MFTSFKWEDHGIKLHPLDILQSYESNTSRQAFLFTGRKDYKVWSVDGTGPFSCKTFVCHLSQDNGTQFSLANTIWKAKVPSKIKAFIWIMVLNKTKTTDLLQIRRSHKVLSPDICVKHHQMENLCHYFYLHFPKT